MPTTVNRNYPYPALTDAPNIPLALENLANAIDNDINTVAASVPQGMASELETRATLLEGRLSTLENRQIKVTGWCIVHTNYLLRNGPLRFSGTLHVPASRVIDYNVIAAYLTSNGNQGLPFVSKGIAAKDDRSCYIWADFNSNIYTIDATFTETFSAAYLV